MIIAQAVGSSNIVWDKVSSSVKMESHQTRIKLDIATQRKIVSMAKILLILKALAGEQVRAKIL
jgi:hypothetical protein